MGLLFQARQLGQDTLIAQHPSFDRGRMDLVEQEMVSELSATLRVLTHQAPREWSFTSCSRTSMRQSPTYA